MCINQAVELDMQYKVNFKVVAALEMAKDFDTVPEEVSRKECDDEASREPDEATLKEVAAQLRKIGDELNKDHAIRALPSLSQMFGGGRILSIFSTVKL